MLYYLSWGSTYGNILIIYMFDIEWESTQSLNQAYFLSDQKIVIYSGKQRMRLDSYYNN